MDYLKYKNYLAHAGQLSYTNTVKKRGGSKYKGGFVNGKNTSAYNHDYYIHNKDKWKTGNSAQYRLKLEQAKKDVKERTGHDLEIENEDDFWVTMAEFYGDDGDSYTPERRRQIYEETTGRVGRATDSNRTQPKQNDRPHGHQRHGFATAGGGVYVRPRNQVQLSNEPVERKRVRRSK